VGVSVPWLLAIGVVDMSATVCELTVDRDAVSGYDENDVLLGGISLAVVAGEVPARQRRRTG
jgi:hypothetical protein